MRRLRLDSGFWRKLFFALLPLLFVLSLLEVSARLYESRVRMLPVEVGNGFQEGSRVFGRSERDPGLIETRAEKLWAFQSQQFSAEKGASLRIAALGESSFYLLQDEFKALESRLIARLPSAYKRVEVINAGGKSYGSQRLLSVAEELLSYSPDLLLIYMGHNEFEEVQQYRLTFLASYRLQILLSHSGLFRVIRDWVTQRIIRQLREQPRRGLPWNQDLPVSEIEKRLVMFKIHLSEIIEMYQKRDIPVIIGTVPSNHLNPRFRPGLVRERYAQVKVLFDSGRFEEAYALGRRILAESRERHQSSIHENVTIRSLAARYRLPLADVERTIERAEPHGIPGETLFDDHCHLNQAGRLLQIGEYERQIIRVMDRRR